MAISLKNSNEGWDAVGASSESSTGAGRGESFTVIFLSLPGCGFVGLVAEEVACWEELIFRTTEVVGVT